MEIKKVVSFSPWGKLSPLADLANIAAGCVVLATAQT
jgi:hypothetical protein